MNKRMRRATLLAVMGFASTAVYALPQNAPLPQTNALTARANAAAVFRANQQFAQLPLAFEPNVGQTAQAVKYTSRGPGYQLWLTDTAAVMALQAPHAKQADILRLHFLGARKAPVTASAQLPGVSNYFVGDKTHWHAGVKNFARVQYQNLYPGIDLAFYGNQRQLEYDYIVKPGAKVEQIALGIDGARRMQVNKDGDLILSTAHGTLVQHKPVVYQMVNGQRRFLDGRYVVRGQKVGFQVASYDRSQPLVIDPVLSYTTYLGGSGLDQGNGIAVDGSGNAYIVGSTQSGNFPGMTGSTASATNQDAFVAKLDAKGNRVWATALGGSNGSDTGTAIALSGSTVYIAGDTTSSNITTTSTALDPSKNSNPNDDGFVMGINAANGTPSYVSYFGGGGTDLIDGIAVDASGNVYVAGATGSDSTLVGKTSTTRIGLPYSGGVGSDARDAFVARFKPGNKTIDYISYFGNGTGVSATTVAEAHGVAVSCADPQCNTVFAYVTGQAQSADAHPGVVAPAKPFSTGPDAFVAKFNTAGSGAASLAYLTYLGGAGSDVGRGIAVNGTGIAEVAGTSNSPGITTQTPLRPNGGGNDAFVARIDTTKTGAASFVYSTFLGGAGNDGGNGIAMDGAGNAYVTGQAASGFPMVSPTQSSVTGTIDAFVARLNSTGDLRFSSYVNNTDFGNGIAVNGSGVVYAVGNTSTTPTSSTASPTALGGGDAFVAAISGFPVSSTTSSPAPSSGGTPTPSNSGSPAPAAGGGGGGGGGCTINPNGGAGDLALPGLLSAALLYLFGRRRNRKS